MRYSPMAAIAALLLVAPGALGQSASLAAAPVDSATVQRAAQDAAEDLLLLRVLTGLRLSASQLSALYPLLQDAQARLQNQERESAEAIGRHKRALEAARNDLLAGKSSSSRAETQYAEAVSLAAAKRAQLRADLVTTLKRALAQHLGAQQEALILQTARAVGIQERTAGWRVNVMGANRGGGPGDFMQQMMDRVRAMSPEEFARSQGRFAGRMGGANAPQMAAMLAQIRAMPPDVYQRERANLAARMMDQMAARRFGDGGQLDPQIEVDRFIDRYFLSPRIVTVVRQQLAARAAP